MNKFVRYTIDKLAVDENDKKLSSGFKINNKKEEDVILIFGINPAGYEEAAQYNKENNLYLGYAGGSNLASLVNNNYYSGIYKFTSIITNNSVKLEWCNQDFRQLEPKMSNLTPRQLKAVKKFYDEHKDNRYTIYLGDLFYYHTTKFKEFKRLIKPMTSAEKYDYAMKMLKLHIEELKKHNKNIKFIYINNAEATAYFQNNKVKTFEYVDGIPVFYGGMLTGQHAMDKTSTLRLVNEIKNKVKL